jgi:hypothetical protein
MQVDTMGASIKSAGITRYQVVGDSVYNGTPVTVIGTTSEMTMQGSGGGGAMAMNGKGTGTGRMYYSRTVGLVIKHTNSMQIESTMQVADMSMNSRNKVDSSMELIRRK